MRWAASQIIWQYTLGAAETPAFINMGFGWSKFAVRSARPRPRKSPPRMGENFIDGVLGEICCYVKAICCFLDEIIPKP